MRPNSPYKRIDTASCAKGLPSPSTRISAVIHHARLGANHVSRRDTSASPGSIMWAPVQSMWALGRMA